VAEHRLSATLPVPVILRRSARARRISLRVSALDGQVTLTVPPRVPEAEAMAFARSREEWIRRHLQTVPQGVPLNYGAMLPVEGEARRIVPAAGRRIELRPAEIAVPRDPVGPALQSWLRQLARDRLAAAADRHAATLGRSYGRITLRDTRSRWGSCSSRGGLSFSWRLILAPPSVLDYVAAHEVAHLAEMNHSPAFWAVVDRLYGPADAARRWLRGNGSDLHRYRFGD
jgi:predicted metal-dependent hydrolase